MRKKLFSVSVLKYLLAAIISAFFVGEEGAKAQLASCGTDVPFFEIDLTGNPDSTWITPSHVRNGLCCGVTSPDRCTSYRVTLDAGAAMINLEIASGAVPPGALFYQIGCGPQIPVGQAICIVGVGPHEVTFCKPGNNQNTYRISSIAKPIFPGDLTTRVGCSLAFRTYGLEAISINSVNSSTGNDTYGAYNSLLNCTNCVETIFTPGLATPSWIDYQICGGPLASICGYVPVCDTIRITTLSRLEASATPNPASFCSGGGGVTLTAHASGGDGNYTYTWRNSALQIVGTGSTYLATMQGSYTVEVRDGLVTALCPAEFATANVIVGEPPIVNAGADQVVCASNPRVILSGSVQFATGGIWSGGAGTFNPNNTSLLTVYEPTPAEVLSGSVTLTLTSTGAGGGCVDDSDDITIFFSPLIDIDLTADPITCFLGTTTINSSFTGGFGPFEYVWSTGETTEDIIVGAGTYSLTIIDSLGCQHTENISLIQPDPILLNFTTVNLSDDLDCDGEATVFATGGVGGFSYLWSNSATSDNITGLCYGLYEVTVTDANGCEAVGSTVVNKPSCLAFEVSAIGSDLDCYAYNDGTASASADFGTLPYEFTWNTIPPQTGPVATNLTAGTYVVTAEDGVGCLKQASVVVTQPSQLLNTITKTDVAVIGENTGSATSNPSGGTPGYSFLWTPGGQITQTAVDLFAGVYYLELKDDNDCTLIDSVKINQPPCNDFLVAVNTTNVLCHGQNNGQANIVILNGNPPFEIAWSNGATNVTAVSGLSPLTYSVTVTDALGCEVFQNFTITQPDLLQVSLVPTNVTCNGAGDGTIDLTVTGGVAPMSYSWFRGGTPFASSEDLINLTPGTYSVVVRDMNNCSATASTGISQPAAINITLTSQVDVTCYEGSDGSLDISVSGGQIPYFYSWTNGETTQDISGLEFGNYQVTVTDGNSCTRTALYVVNQPAEVEILDVVVPCPVPGATTVDITVSEIFGGALDPYSISLDNGATFNASGTYKFSVNTGTDYELVARDNNGCISPVYNLSIDPTVTIDDIIFNPCIPVGNTTQLVEVVPAGGDGVSYEVSTDGAFTFAAPGVFTFSLNISSSYDIVVRDSKGCLSAVERIFVPGVLTATPNLDTEVSCVGEDDGAVSLMVTGGVPPFTFSWDGPGLFTSSDQNISGLFEGTYEVLVTDSNNCTTTASIFVSTILDITNPVITCAVVDSQFVFADLDECFYTHNSDLWDATATDNCVVSSIVYVLSGVTTGSGTTLDGVEFNVGITLVTWTATDGLGNTDQCSYYVVVTDTQDPVITNCPDDIFVNNDADVCGATVTWVAPSASDNCEIQSFTSTHNSGDFFPVGITTVTYTLADTSGNVVTCSFDVVVTDTQDPVITNCPDDIFVNNDADVCGATVTWVAPSASDNCEIQSFTSTHNSGDFFPVGTTTVTYTLADTSGNVVTCSFDVVVTDTQDPVITNCPDDIFVNNDADVCGATVTWVAPSASDNCEIQSFTSTHNSGDFFPVGTTTVTYTLADTSGNVVTCSFDVVVTDTQDPVITNCPDDIFVNNDADVCGATVTWVAPSASDNCEIQSFTSTHNSGDFFPVGTTTVTYTLADTSGNVVTCSFDVVVTDTQDPVITNCPDDIFVNNDADVCGAMVTWVAPSASDNCEIQSFTSTHNSGDFFPVGTTTVTYTLADTSGNVVTCSFDVVVTDTQDPVITNCPDDIFVNNDADVCGATVTWVAPSASDNCEIQSFTSTHNSGDFFPVGTTTVTYTLADTSGNVVTCSFDVVVTDTQDPVITNCPDDIFVNNDADVCGAMVTWVAPSASDNCEIQSFTSTHNSGDFFPVGTTTVTYTLADTSGNVVTCSFDVVVTDNENPVITTCPGDIATCDSLVFFNIPTATDNCGSITITQTQGLTSGSIFPVGTTLQEFEIEDQYGNISVCSFNVTIHPTATLSVASTDVQCFGFANGMIDLTVTSGTPPFTYIWSNGADTEDISGLEPGQYSVTVSDFFGCSETISASISQPTELMLSAVSQNISCNGFSDGWIDATVSGGVLPYTYSWSNGADTEDISGLAAGQYGLTVTDFNGCEKIISITLTEPQVLAASATSIDATCSANDGLIDLTVTGGTTPYSYEWSNGATTQDISDLVYGDYTVTITDANGCELIFTETVSSISIFNISARIRDVLCYGDATGSISIEMLDGTRPFAIDWSNGETGSTINNLTAGEYTVFVTDSNMCQVTETYIVTETDELFLELFSPTLVADYNVSNYGATDGSVELEILGGTAPYSFNWSNGMTSQNIDNVGAGEYFVIVTDANGCIISDRITLTQSMALDIPEGFSPNNDGKNDYFVIKGVEIYPDNTLEIYNRWGNLVYKKNGYNNEWDGNNMNGKELPDATYFVIFKIHNIGFQYNGYVDLRRSR
jgi:gliding motility-associated-like protein